LLVPPLLVPPLLLPPLLLPPLLLPPLLEKEPDEPFCTPPSVDEPNGGGLLPQPTTVDAAIKPRTLRRIIAIELPSIT
jgi:hypothetical protein